MHFLWQNFPLPRFSCHKDSGTICPNQRICLAKGKIFVTITLASTFQQFLDDMANLSQLRASTRRAYGYELKAASLDPAFHKPLDQISLTDLEDWISRAAPAPSTLGRRAAAFSSFFQWAVRHDYCPHNPLQGRAPIRAPRRLPRPIRHQSAQTALDAAIAAAPQPYRLIFTLLRETGMRVGEVLNLRRGDVSLDAGREGLHVRDSKTNTERIVILGATATPKSLRGLRAHLKALSAREPHALLFPSNRGTRISYDAAHYQWHRVCTAAGFVDAAGKPLYTLHQLRHTRGSELMAQGYSIEIVQRVLGHKDIRSTLGYAELNDTQVRAALEKRR
jgi:integrase/recombinase XerD